MIVYASRTGTLRNQAALRAAGWRLLLTPVWTSQTFGLRYALDNGAWTAYQQAKSFDSDRFLRMVERRGSDADWVALPDIVEGGLRSLEWSLTWIDRLKGIAPLLLPVQDGMSARDVAGIVGGDIGLFVGGSTQFKEATLPVWGELARSASCWLHVGRVNTARRVHLCAAAGATSFDGTSVSMYASTLPLIDNAARQSDLFRV